MFCWYVTLPTSSSQSFLSWLQTHFTLWFLPEDSYPHEWPPINLSFNWRYQALPIPIHQLIVSSSVAQCLQAFYNLSTDDLTARGLWLASTKPFLPISSDKGANDPNGHESDDSNVSGSNGFVDTVEKVLVKEPLFLPGTPKASEPPQLGILHSPSTPFHFSDGGCLMPKGMLSFFIILSF